MKLTLVATCLFGLEKLLGQEIDALGFKRVDTMDGRVTFECSEQDVAKANIWLRCAEHVYIPMASFQALSFTDLFEGTKAVSWEEWIGKQDAFPVKGHSVQSTLSSIPDCQSIIKKAVAQRLGSHYGISWMPEDGITYQISFFLFKDKCSLMIDTSGIPLHKRGYRPLSGIAPLRETLAAALALISRPRYDVLTWDPFCGSGTIAIETAMILSNKAPGLSRAFAGEQFPNLTKESWISARKEAREAEKTDRFLVYASDIDDNILQLCAQCAQNAGVSDHLKIFHADATAIRKTDGKGTVVCNPPYGERMMEIREAEELYRKIGLNFKDLAPWNIYILTSSERFEKLYGRRADKIRKLYNGMIPCYLYQYFKPQAK